MSIQGSVNQAIGVTNALYTQTDKYKEQQTTKTAIRDVNRELDIAKNNMALAKKIPDLYQANVNKINSSSFGDIEGIENLQKKLSMTAQVWEKHYADASNNISKAKDIMDKDPNLSGINMLDSKNKLSAKWADIGNKLEKEKQKGLEAMQNAKASIEAKITQKNAFKEAQKMMQEQFNQQMGVNA